MTDDLDAGSGERWPSHDRGPCLLIGNPTSKQGKAARLIGRTRKLLNAHGLVHEFRSTLPGGATTGLVARAIEEEGFRTVICLGGDGTFNEVAKGIVQAGRTGEVCMGLLPAGTANDQGKSFGLSSRPQSLERNIGIIAAGHTTRLDVGEVTALADNGMVLRRDLFFDSAGWGLSASILQFRNRELEIVRSIPIWRNMYRDHMVYIRAAVHKLGLVWLTRDRFAAEIVTDGVVHNFERLTDLVLSNTLLYAGEWIIDPGAAHDDGLIEVAPFAGMRDWTSKLIVQHKKVPLTEELLNRFGVRHTPVLKGREIRIQIFRPNVDKRLPAQLDGEEFQAADHFQVKVHPRMLRLIVPAGFHWI
ncbi:MAG TPA: diacylglycerol kinase family protein [Polyangia bacterium]|nr:diacylglycerol kinase family protein [Polyangia bacterium]